MRFKFSLVALVIVATVTALRPAPARAADDAASFIADLGNQALQILSSQRPLAEREKEFRVLFDKAFDVNTIARFVLGPYWRRATEAQRQEFIRLFTTYIVHVYTVRLSEYSNEQFKVTGSRPESENSIIVNSLATSPGSDAPTHLDWRVIKTANGFKITDVIVEGVSMAITEREEFASVIQRGGGNIEALLKMLREKTGQS
jgi:phospholipid transport system substrate-binding protein